MSVSIVRIHLAPGAEMPTRGSAGASGYDLYAPQPVCVGPHSTVVIHSGVSIELPDDTWEAQIRGRSGLSKRGLWIALGTIDSDYRGIIGATVANITNRTIIVQSGERFAQLVFARVAHPEFSVVDALGETSRGSGGFGSTGK